ncbi:hypothetical protein BY996DRAFT_6452086 [Phakopsora pachyrhizi]|nr:hypothetical protein BY996DRAFT_6452086 [Phakopsora pachyrhizi]
MYQQKKVFVGRLKKRTRECRKFSTGNNLKDKGFENDMQVRGVLIADLVIKYLSGELKKDKKMYEMIERRNIDEDIRNIQEGKSAGVTGWLNMPLFGYAIANYPKRPLYYFSLESMHTHVPIICYYLGCPPF